MITEIREPVVAGTFYDFDKVILKQGLKELFKGVPKGDYRCVISPHAGYIYSGKTAAYAINGLKETKRFLIIGPNHNVIGAEFSIMSSGIWRTPLGDCKIDEEIAKEIRIDILKEDFSAHQFEHSIEVQLPFLQYRFKEFSFVPISIKNISYSEVFLNNCEKLGKKIASMIKKNQDVCLIASSDFSHYLPQRIADEKDKKAIDKIKDLDTKGFFRVLKETDASICGYGGIAVIMQVARELGLKAYLIHKSSSGDVTKDFDSVVSYYAIGFK